MAKRKNKPSITSVQRQAEQTLTAEIRKKALFVREEFAEADADGDTSEGLDAARMKRVVPVRGLEALLKHPDMSEDLIMAANHYHTDLMIAEGVGSSEVKERVDTSGSPIGMAEYMADCRIRLAKVRNRIGGTADLVRRLDEMRGMGAGTSKIRHDIEKERRLRDVRMRFIDAVFTHHPDKRLTAIYGKGRPYARTRDVGMEALVRLSEVYGLRTERETQ